jgi:hypothetical protein
MRSEASNQSASQNHGTIAAHVVEATLRGANAGALSHRACGPRTRTWGSLIVVGFLSACGDIGETVESENADTTGASLSESADKAHETTFVRATQALKLPPKLVPSSRRGRDTRAAAE